jgi:hypothetical protein
MAYVNVPTGEYGTGPYMPNNLGKNLRIFYWHLENYCAMLWTRNEFFFYFSYCFGSGFGS